MIVTLPCAVNNRAPLFEMDGKDFSKFLGAAFCKAMAQTATFYGVSLILVGEAVVLLNLQPIMVCMIAWRFLGEDIGLYDFILSVLTIVGVVITCNPNFHDLHDGVRIHGILVMVAAAALNSVGNCLTRFLGRVHFSTLICTQACIGLPFISAIFFLTSAFVLPGYRTLIYTVTLCLLAITGRCLETKAFQIANATPLTILKTLEIAICFLLQYFVLGVELTPMSICGTALVTVCVIAISTKKRIFQLVVQLVQGLRSNKNGDRQVNEPSLEEVIITQNQQYGAIGK